MRRLPLIPMMAAAVAAQAHAPRRIVSLNLCADQYLVALADPTQIAGLTRLSRLPALSPIVAQARHYPVADPSAEALLATAPDLILTGWAGQADPAIAAGLKTQVLPLPPADNYRAIVDQVRLVAAAIGHPERGTALIRRMDADLATIPATGRGRVAADYQRHGYLSGTSTLVDEMMSRVGLVNLATRLGLPPLAHLSLEQLVAHRPDLLIAGGGPTRDLGSLMLAHPAIRTIPRVTIPAPLLDCGGPLFPTAVRRLSDQLR